MRTSDPLALDPLGPMVIDPLANLPSPSDPLSLDPLSPIDREARPVGASASVRRIPATAREPRATP
jgi:hypothetical protein